MSRVDEIRREFPALEREVYGRRIVYFDNAATSERCAGVLDVADRINRLSNANVHRAVHLASSEATDLYEKGREAARVFLGAQSREEVIFTSGTTAAINLVASSLGRLLLREGDEVVVSEAEHHSNIVPWQLACAATGASLKAVSVEADGSLSAERFGKAISQNTKIVAVAHISNVLGVVNPVEEITRMAHQAGAVVLIDGAQGAVHCNVDVQRIGCDFYVFSGHKLFALPGTGILYGRKSLLDAMPPYMGGGDMVDTVTFEKTTYAPLPLKYEAGTPNFLSGATLAPALELLSAIHADSELIEHEKTLSQKLLDGLCGIEGLHVPSAAATPHIPLYSFHADGVHTTDLAMILDKMGIATRSGLMCAEPIVRRFSGTGMLRVSLMPYNTEEEVDYFITCLKRAIKMLR